MMTEQPTTLETPLATNPMQAVVSDALLPCPFCGATPRVVADNGYGDCQVFCSCALEPCASDTASEAGLHTAIVCWNRRVR